MMLDRDIVAVSPSSTYRVLKGAGLLDLLEAEALALFMSFSFYLYIDVSPT